MQSKRGTTRTLIGLFATCVLATACGDTTLVTSPAEEARPLVGANLTNRGWIYGRGDQPVEVTYQVIDGMAVLEGDMVLGTYGSIPRTREELETRRMADLSVISSSGGRRWTNGVVPYVISTSFTTTERQAILTGISLISQAAYGITLRPRVASDTRWVDVRKSTSACNSFVGAVGGGQVLNLTSGCTTRAGVVAHEFLHALGTFHEQSRCDRDSFVTVNWNNIRPGAPRDNFAKMCSGASDWFEYDEASVMHYPAYTSDPYFVVNPFEPMLTSKRGRTHLMGNRDSLVSVDRRTINAMYPPPSPNVSVSYNANGHPVFTWAAMPGVQSYRLTYTSSHQFYSPEYGSIIYDATIGSAWTTTATTWTDFSKQYNGPNEVCYYSNPSVPEEEWRTYGYSIEAVYADATTRTLFSADVFACPPY